jgi:RNA polymerase sigma-70 factor (ECF subfamily)
MLGLTLGTVNHCGDGDKGMAPAVAMWPTALAVTGGRSGATGEWSTRRTGWSPGPLAPGRAVESGAAPVAADPELKLLIDRARTGNTEALGGLYDRYSPAIYRYLYRRTSDAALSEDLTGTVFLRMLEALKKDQAWDESFSGWLYRIAHNLLTDHMRARSRRPETELPETLPASHEPRLDDRVERTMANDAIQKAINQLKPEYTEVLLMRFTEGLSHADVAARLGKTETAVKVTQHRALKALRSRLGGWVEEQA